VHQGRRLQRRAALLPGEEPVGEPAQLLVDERQELVGRLPVALARAREQRGDRGPAARRAEGSGSRSFSTMRRV